MTEQRDLISTLASEPPSPSPLTGWVGGTGPLPKTSRFTGVGWSKRLGKWQAHITLDRRKRHLGIFDDEAAAAKAYDAAARKALGPYAMLNFPTAADRQRAAELIGRREACRRVGVSIKTWERWQREGQLPPAVRIGGGFKWYKLADIERLVAECGRLQPPYPDPERPGCYRVPLTGLGMRRREAVISAESLPLVEGKRWCWTPGGTGGPSVVQARNGETTALRRIIMGIADTDIEVGHINGDPLDCRIENLQVRSTIERVWGTRKRRTHRGRPCSSRFKGVSWQGQSGRWRAQLRAEGRTHYLGSYDDEIDAAKAYDEAARKYFGEHAWLNFPDRADGERGGALELLAEPVHRPAAAA